MPVTRVEENPTAAPSALALFQNYPNPFNPATTIRFSLPQRQHAMLKVFDVSGNEIATLVNGELERGEHVVAFEGQSFPSGIYFYVLTAGKFTQTRKAILVR